MKSFSLAALSVAILSTVCSVEATEKPNIIVIYTDDHGWPDIGAADIYEDLKTPHINALAASGVLATNGYSTAPQCVPSRAGLLAGKSQNRFGVEGNGHSLDGFDAERTIAERLKEADYATGQIGKWHLGPATKIGDHGFDDFWSKNRNAPCYGNFSLAGERIPIQEIDDGLYHLDACTEGALTFIDRHANQPFFLYLAYRAPHVPLDAPKHYLDRFPGEMPERRRQALAMIAAMDDGVGEIVAELEKRNLRENTLIFFIGDNGAPLKIHKLDAPGGGPGWDGSLNKPMNGEKGMLSEGGIRVPFVVSFPKAIPAGQIYDGPLSALDVAATALEVAELSVDETLDGVNVIPYLSGDATALPERTLYWRWISQSAIRDGDWKLLRGSEREYLFNLKDDPGELNNLSKAMPEKANELRAKLRGWAAELDPPGLATKPMSQTWNQYFDFYLDGKPPVSPKQAGAEPAKVKEVSGLICRNGGISKVNGALRVVPASSKKSPFLVAAKLNVHTPCTISIESYTEKEGSVGVAWRRKSDGDFTDGNTLKKPTTAGEWGIETFSVPAGEPIVHLRVLLPLGESKIHSITLKSDDHSETTFRFDS